MKYLDPPYAKVEIEFQINFVREIRGGESISKIFVPGVQIFKYFWTGGTKIGGFDFLRQPLSTKADYPLY